MASTSKELPSGKSLDVSDINDISKRNLKELRAIARELKLKNYSTLNKQDLINFIVNRSETYYDGSTNDKLTTKKHQKTKKDTMDKEVKEKTKEAKNKTGKTIKPNEPKAPKEKKVKIVDDKSVSTKPNDMKSYK